MEVGTRFPHQTWNFSKEEIKGFSRNRDSQNVSPGGFQPASVCTQRGTTEPTTAAAESASNLCYLCNNLNSVYCDMIHFSNFRCFGVGHCKIRQNFCPVLFWNTLISDRLLVNIRTTYKTMCRSCKKGVVV